ncbi:MAG: hypothetical protein AAF645_18820 [Myxococcota bacterium]
MPLRLTLALLCVVALACDSEEDGPVPAALPRPAPPTARVLGAASAGAGWGWVNPRPRTMPSWNDVAVGDVAVMVGPSGRVARFDGRRLSRVRTGTESTLHGVALLGPTQSLVVGENGTAIVLLNAGPRSLTTGVSTTLRGAVATGPTSAAVVGDEGIVLRLNDLQASPVTTNRSETLLAVAARGDDLWAVGERGIVLHIVGTNVEVEKQPRGATLRAVGGCAGGPLFAAGDDGQVFQRLEDGSWRRSYVAGDDDWQDLSCIGPHVALAGAGGHVALVSRTDSVLLQSGTRHALRGIGAAEGGAYAVGDQGRLFRLERDHLVALSTGPTANVLALEHLGGALVGAGEFGRILRWREGRIVLESSGTDEAIAALAKVDEATLVAVGDGGTVRQIRWDGVDDAVVVGSASLRDVVARDGRMLAVGTGGHIAEGAIGHPRVRKLDFEGTLWTVAGTPDSAIIAGDDGAVFEYAEGRAVRRRCGTRTLRSAVRAGESTWLAGDGGVIAEFRDSQCQVVREGGADLYAIDLGPDGELLAVGDGGAALTRSEGVWATVDLGADGVALRSILRTEREVFVGGAGGAILSHRRTDQGG